MAFVKDHFLCEIFNSFQALVNQAKLDRKIANPYLADYYNVKAFFYRRSHLMTSATSRILNSNIEALNDAHRLPRFLVVALDKDVITHLKDFDFGATKNLEAIVNWLTRQIDIITRRKRLQFSEKKPGAIGSRHHPTIIYIEMLRQAVGFDRKSKMAQCCSLRMKFNQALAEAAVKQNHRIISIRDCSAFDHFYMQGNLSSKGKLSFWKEIDNLLERFDKGEISLNHIMHHNNNRFGSQLLKNQW